MDRRTWNARLDRVSDKPPGRQAIEPAAHLVNPPHRLAIRPDQDGAVVDDGLRVALVLDA